MQQFISKLGYRLIGVLVLGLLVLGRSLGVAADEGDLDPSFGMGGRVDTPVAYPIDSEPNAMTHQADGKILVVGAAFGYRTDDFAVTRHNPDGSLDATFGGDGRVITDFAYDEDHAAAVAVQADGKIVLGGYATGYNTYKNFALARYNPDGSLDSTFGIGGKVITDLGSNNDQIAALVIQADGKIVAAGTSFSQFTLARYNSNGSLDASFGTGGIVQTIFSGGDSAIYALALQPDGRLVVAGMAHPASSLDFALARYTPDGSLDVSFGTGGKVITDFSTHDDTAYALAVQPDGKVLTAGLANAGTANWDFGLVRYNANGSLDPTFGTGGKVTTDFTGEGDQANSLTLQGDGKILAAGFAHPVNHDFALARYTADGNLDASFGTGGKVITSGGPAIAVGMALQTGGQIVAAGLAATYDLALVRYHADGSLDPAFGNAGILIVSLVASGASIATLAYQSDGKILAAGPVPNPRGPEGFGFVLARYTLNGNLDPTFGANGIVSTTVGTYSEVNALAVQPDGKILAAGRATLNSFLETDFALARYNPDGSLDPSFGIGGIVTTDFPHSMSERVNALVVQPNGKIVAVGSSNYPGEGFALVRYNANGSLDLTFGTGGKVVTDLGYAAAALLQPDGKIVAAGIGTDAAFNEVFSLVRYNPDGSLDPGFGTGGIVKSTFRGSGTSVARQADGKIVVAGTVPGAAPYTSDFGLARFNLNGSTDTGFGIAGLVKTDFGNYDQANGMAILPDQKIVVAGVPGLARYTPAGNLDPTFGVGGKITSELAVYALLVQADNKLVSGGAIGASDGSSGTDFGLERYLNSAGPGPTVTPTSGTSASPTPTATATACPLGFNDVLPGSTFYDAIRCLACRGIIGGYPCSGPGEPCPGSYFRPNNNVTRGQVSKIVAESAGFNDVVPSTQQTFEDVAPGSTFHLWIERLGTRGILGGYPCGGPFEPCVAPTNRPYFRPNNPVTRGQVSKIVASAAGWTETPTGQTFADVPPGSTFYLYVERVAVRGIIGGYPCGGAEEPCLPPANRPYFRPNNPATRGQISKIAANAFFPNCQTPADR